MNEVVCRSLARILDVDRAPDKPNEVFHLGFVLRQASIEKAGGIYKDVSSQSVPGMPSAIHNQKASADSKHNSEQGYDHRRKGHRVIERPLPKGFAYFIFGVLFFGSVGGALLAFLDSRRRLF
ncbi:hypothetical protein X771_27630 [Mesorhizobium sp. LSJC277A00]|nr:hypothetical protein X771_27630 [Mesorhizobium sp. LSJC277A00]